MPTITQLHGLTVRQIREIFKKLSSDALPLHWLDGWLSYVLNQPLAFFITDGDYQPTKDEISNIQAGLARLSSGEPLAYLIGRQSFWGREFLVNAHTLIPRADTEILIETVLNHPKFKQNADCLDDTKKPITILDLGTGTGCIGITLALELPLAQVTLVDVSTEALKIAAQNSQRLKAGCQVLQSDWFAKVTDKFDLIITNPPYINENDEHLARLQHEPITALVAAESGLADIRRIIEEGRAYLNDGGMMVIEHGFDQAAAVRTLYEQAGYANVRTVQDYGANERATLGQYRQDDRGGE
ncbi:peptide chain release factor N(5)-glutamine methyltransferase [Moraxella canis]|uniref:peptide chain release factor N(5)-glutamine methyltransferase n=1 Tax=Moraxella canis TaxID=90239 RepID=UPI0006689386|nr:peptide chain release factor N(5)-glutamine methyltransferase [Moraxella canis]